MTVQKPYGSSYRRFRGTLDSDLINAKEIRLGGVSLKMDDSGRHHYVNPDSGSDGYGVSTRAKPYATMSKAFSVLESGDTIHMSGKIREQLTTPVQVFDVTIIGDGNRPRHADAAPAPVGGHAAATWTFPASGSTDDPLLTVLQQGWRIVNFVMAGHATDACVYLNRAGGADDAERDPSHFEAHNIRFASGQDGIEDNGGSYNVGIYGCSFHDLTGFALKTNNAGVTVPYRWQIVGNRFASCANWMGEWFAHQFEIRDNVVIEITTPGLDTSGGSGHNVVVDNYFDIAAADFDPVGGFTAHATDIWSNTLLNAVETGVPAN